MLRIKELLKEKNQTQVELANKLGVSTIGLNKIINGNPTVETLEKIAAALGVHIQDLFESKPSDLQPIYIKQGEKLVQIGEIDLNNIQ